MQPPGPSAGRIYARAQELDATLRDAVEDLGFGLDVADSGPTPTHTSDLDMIERANQATGGSAREDQGTWVVSARLESLGGDTFLLRVVTVPPRGRQLRVRVERVDGVNVAVRGLVMARDLLAARNVTRETETCASSSSTSNGVMSELRSPGRAVLAANAALFGAFTAFSMQRAGGSDDPRLLYPLLTLGTGAGLGAALLVADEFDVGTGDAWTLAGGAWWGAASGILIANGRPVLPLSDRYFWGVSGGLVGLSLAGFALTRRKGAEGNAVLVHSGAALGLGLGALGEFFYRGDLDARTPYTGTGYGSAIGLVLAGSASMFVREEPSRVLLVDLGAALGAAAGAAIASPLLFENVTERSTRGFVASTFGGTLLGGAAAWLLTRSNHRTPDQAKRSTELIPSGGIVGTSPLGQPVYGLGVEGTW